MITSYKNIDQNVILLVPHRFLVMLYVNKLLENAMRSLFIVFEQRCVGQSQPWCFMSAFVVMEKVTAGEFLQFCFSAGKCCCTFAHLSCVQYLTITPNTFFTVLVCFLEISLCTLSCITKLSVHLLLNVIWTDIKVMGAEKFYCQ